MVTEARPLFLLVCRPGKLCAALTLAVEPFGDVVHFPDGAVNGLDAAGSAQPFRMAIVESEALLDGGVEFLSFLEHQSSEDLMSVVWLGDHPPWLGDNGEAWGPLLESIPVPVELPLLVSRIRMLTELQARCRAAGRDLERLSKVGIALSSERNLNRLLERILEEARAINAADAGTLYTLDAERGVLNYQILQNESMGIRMGGHSGEQINLPPVPLERQYVSAHVALTRETVNIPDVYEAAGFDFTGPRKYDSITGYRSRSMLVVPIVGPDDDVIGVLQLINARRRDSGEVVPFLSRNVERTQALASQAGISLTNARLILDLQQYLEGLIQVMATAVDEKSAHTSGHIHRVTRYSVLLAQSVNQCADGSFGGFRFNEEELEEIRIAGLLHDIGKIVIPEHIVSKATKLERVYDRIDLIRTRFSVIRRGIELGAMRRKIECARDAGCRARWHDIEDELAAELDELSDDLKFLESINTGGEFMAPERKARLDGIAEKIFVDDQGTVQPYLIEDEIRNLSISRGTLLPEELQIIRRHAEASIRLLAQIPFSKKLRNVPVFAGDHHEMLNGSGYPQGKRAEDLPLQSRILAVADIFDALTASDRPYRKADPCERAYAILRDEVARGRLDGRLVELFISAGVQQRFASERDSQTQATHA